MSKTRTDRVELFAAKSWYHVDQRLVWHWSYVSGNGRVLADGGQGYSRRIDALEGARRVTGVNLGPEPDFTQDFDFEPKPRQVWEIVR